jgi:hypothetical protein
MRITIQETHGTATAQPGEQHLASEQGRTEAARTPAAAGVRAAVRAGYLTARSLRSRRMAVVEVAAWAGRTLRRGKVTGGP